MGAVNGIGLSSASTDAKDGHATELGPLAVPRNMVKGDGEPKEAICRPYGVRKNNLTALGTIGS